MKKLRPGDVTQEVERFQGTWRQIEWEADDYGPGVRSTFAGNTFEVTGADGSVLIKGYFSVDPTQEPKAVDWTDTFGPDAGKTFPAIYSFEGDRLIFCAADEGQERPKELRAGPGQVLRILEREKL